MDLSKPTTITNVHVFDGDKVLDGPHHVVIRGSLVVNISPSSPHHPLEGTQIVDGSGCTLLPGLIDSHVHVETEQQLDDLALGGVTTALDMASWPPSLTAAMRGASTAGGHPKPAVLSAGLFATGPGSTHSKLPRYPPEAILTSPDQAEGWVAQRVAEGSDYIKLVADVPGPAQDLLNALVKAATKAGKKTVVHAASHEAFLMAVESNADCITHLPTDKAVEPQWAKKLADGQRVVCPTVIMMKGMVEVKNRAIGAGIMGGTGVSDLAPKPKLSLNHAIESVRILKDAGVQILVGTDANSAPFCPVEHGKSMQEEMELLLEAGMEPVEILRAATSLPADYWGLKGKGALRLGAVADLILVRGQPFLDITHIKNLEMVWIRGRTVEGVKRSVGLAGRTG